MMAFAKAMSLKAQMKGRSVAEMALAKDVS
jgi:hypothetical protein